MGEITQCVCSKGSNYTFPVWLRVIVNTFLPRVRVNYKYFFYLGLGLIINTILHSVRVTYTYLNT